MIETLQERFWRRVEKNGRNECWEWQGSFKDRYHHYGIMWFGGKKFKAHRVSWELHNGEIPAGLHVLHQCDNPKCVNPNHLFIGTHTDNMRDMFSKGRCQSCSGDKWQKAHAGTFQTGEMSYYRRNPEKIRRGEANPTAKLTERQVREIKFSIKESGGRRGICKELGDKYGFPGGTIQKIKQGKTWAHINV